MQHMLVEHSISSGLHSDANFYTNAAGKTGDSVAHMLQVELILTQELSCFNMVIPICRLVVVMSNTFLSYTAHIIVF